MDESFDPTYGANPFLHECHLGEPDWCWEMRKQVLEAVDYATDVIDRLEARIRTLEAGVEKEAAYCEKWQGEAIQEGQLVRAERHEQRAARLRALLK